MKQLVSFFLDDQLFGIDIQLAREVNPDINIIPVPLARKEICGLVNIRGQVILVVNLSALLGMPPRIPTSESHIIILKTTQEYIRQIQFTQVPIINVMIYFSVELRKEIAKQFNEILQPEGFLLLGASETLYRFSEGFRPHHHGETIVYRTQK